MLIHTLNWKGQSSGTPKIKQSLHLKEILRPLLFLNNETIHTKYIHVYRAGRRGGGGEEGWGGGGGKRRGMGPRNDVLITCKAVTLSGGQRIIAVFSQ